jgi:hypothetical protein
VRQSCSTATSPQNSPAALAAVQQVKPAAAKPASSRPTKRKEFGMSEETALLNLPASGPLECFLEAVSDAISEGFEQMGGLTPLVFAVTEKGNGYVIGVPSRLGAGDPDKTDERVAKWMRNHFRKHDVIRYAFVSETHETQQEIVAIEAEDYNGAVVGFRKIIRAEGNARLGSLRTFHKAGFFGGKLLPERGRLN